VLFDEDDIKEGLPKAVAAVKKLSKVNSDINLEAVVADINSSNILEMCSDMDIILDGTDNFNTRYLINDASIKLGIPWIYGGAIGSTGMTYTIIPGVTPCFRCIFNEIPPLGAIDTCDTVGVLNSITNIVASLQSTEAIKYLAGKQKELIEGLRFIDVWNGDYEVIPLTANSNCQVCKLNDFSFLNNNNIDEAVFLCGSNSVQINYNNKEILIDNIFNRLKNNGIDVKKNIFYLKFKINNTQVTLFNDGRAIMKGITDLSEAKNIYAKYIGA